MKSLKTVLFYLLGLAGLIIASVLFTGQDEVEISNLPRPTGVATPTPTVQAVPPAEPAACHNPVRNTNGNSYLPNAPLTTRLIPPDDSGEPLVVSGAVYLADGVTPAAKALIEIWQTDREGHYSRRDSYAFRARLYTDETGHYQFVTVKPGNFQVDCQFLPAHIHYKISYAKHRPLFASLYFEGDRYLSGALLITPRLIRPIIRHKDPEDPFLETNFDLVLSSPASDRASE